MIKFIKKELITICTVIGVILICIGIIRIVSICMTKDEYKDNENNNTIVTKDNIKEFLNETNESGLREYVLSYSNRALANIEYLKLEELENITKEIKRFNDNYKKTVLYENGLSDTLDLE